MELPPLFLVAARALHFWAVAVLFGGAGFALLRGQISPDQVSLYARRTLRAAAGLAALSGVAWFAATFVEITGTSDAFLDPASWQAFLAAPFGPPWAIRLALCVVCAGLAAARNSRPAFAGLILAAGCGMAIDQAWLGHAAMASDAGVMVQIPVYWLHVLAGYAWTGALVMVCVVSFEAGRVPARSLALFSRIGIAVVTVLVLTGIANAGFRDVTPAHLLASQYGQVVALKVSLVVLMIALAFVNRRRGRHADTNAPATLWLETAIGLVVLIVAAVLGTTPPPNG